MNLYTIVVTDKERSEQFCFTISANDYNEAEKFLLLIAQIKRPELDVTIEHPFDATKELEKVEADMHAVMDILESMLGNVVPFKKLH